MIENEKRYKLTKKQFDLIKKIDLNWSIPYQLTDIVFSKTGKVDIDIVDWIVRLRKKDCITKIEYKSPLNKELTKWEELSLTVNDFTIAFNLLNKIGLNSGLILDRYRMDGIWENFKIALDDFKHLGYFIEIENITFNSQIKSKDFFKAFNIEVGENCLPYGKLFLQKINENPIFKEKLNKELFEYNNYSTKRVKI